MTHRAKLRAYAVSILFCLAASSALAQTPEERAGARAAARSGVEAYNNGKHAESLDLFMRAEKLLHAPTHLLFIARNNAKLGKLVRAQEAYQQLAREKLGADAPKPFLDAQQSAAKELGELEARIPMVTVKLKGVSDSSQVKVTIDDQPVSSALVGIPFPADPGAHRFAASAPGYLAKPVEKTLAESSRSDVELALVATGESTTPAPATAVGQSAANATPSERKLSPAPEAQSGSSYRVPAFIALGVGAVGVLAGTFFVYQWNDKNTDADKQASDCDSRDKATGDAVCSPGDWKRIKQLDDDAYTNGVASTVSYIVGGVAVATGVTLLLLDGGSSKTSQAALEGPTVHAYVGPSQIGLTGTF